MRTSVVLADSAAPLILSTLLRRGQIRLPLHDVLLSSPDPAALARTLAKASHRGSGPRPSRVAESGSSENQCAELLRDLPGFSPSPKPAAPGLHIAALATQSSLSVAPPSDLLSLPLTLADVASLYRAKHLQQSPSPPRVSRSPAALLEGRGGPDSVLRDAFELHCGPGSKDLLIVDSIASSPAEASLWEALLVAECSLRSSGALLAISPTAFSARVRRFLRWRFLDAHCATSADGATHYALCTSLATDFGDAAVRRDDFPGLLTAATRRPRKWNPYRRAEQRKFVVSVRPGFTNAPYRKDALLRSAALEKEREEKLREADDAFFTVAHEMVEKGTHYKQPDN